LLLLNFKKNKRKDQRRTEEEEEESETVYLSTLQKVIKTK